MSRNKIDNILLTTSGHKTYLENFVFGHSKTQNKGQDQNKGQVSKHVLDVIFRS